MSTPLPPDTVPPAGTGPDGASVGDIIGSVTRDLSTLVRQELALARAELRQEAARTGRAAGMLGGAGVAVWFVLLFLSIAVWSGFRAVMDDGWAAFVVALIWVLVGGMLYVAGLSRFRRVDPAPRRTVADAARERIRPRGETS